MSINLEYRPSSFTMGPFPCSNAPTAAFFTWWKTEQFCCWVVTNTPRSPPLFFSLIGFTTLETFYTPGITTALNHSKIQKYVFPTIPVKSESFSISPMDFPWTVSISCKPLHALSLHLKLITVVWLFLLHCQFRHAHCRYHEKPTAQPLRPPPKQKSVVPKTKDRRSTKCARRLYPVPSTEKNRNPDLCNRDSRNPYCTISRIAKLFLQTRQSCHQVKPAVLLYTVTVFSALRHQNSDTPPR